MYKLIKNKKKSLLPRKIKGNVCKPKSYGKPLNN